MTDQSINKTTKSINQSINQKSKKSINQSIDQMTDQSINKTIKSMNQAINQSIKWRINRLIKQPFLYFLLRACCIGQRNWMRICGNWSAIAGTTFLCQPRKKCWTNSGQCSVRLTIPWRKWWLTWGCFFPRCWNRIRRSLAISCGWMNSWPSGWASTAYRRGNRQCCSCSRAWRRKTSATSSGTRMCRRFSPNSSGRWNYRWERSSYSWSTPTSPLTIPVPFFGPLRWCIVRKLSLRNVICLNNRCPCHWLSLDWLIACVMCWLSSLSIDSLIVRLIDWLIVPFCGPSRWCIVRKLFSSEFDLLLG